MPCEQSIVEAKTNFATKVSDGIASLMQCGYSRERATNALIRELNRGETCIRPADEEIFDTMRRYGLGIEEATKTIVISTAVRRALLKCESPTQAIDVLASKISLTNLLYDSSDEEMSSDGDLSIRPELRVEPVVPVDRQLSSRKKLSANRKPRSSNKIARPRNNKIAMTGRKRSIEETVPIEKKETRARADSVTEEVDAKINAKKSNEENREDSIMRTPVVRGKRVLRVDEAECVNQTNCHKRIRTSEC